MADVSYEYEVEFTGKATVYFVAEDDEEAESIVELANPDDSNIGLFDIKGDSIEVVSATLVKKEEW